VKIHDWLDVEVLGPVSWDGHERVPGLLIRVWDGMRRMSREVVVCVGPDLERLREAVAQTIAEGTES
jgi:hypothetical protein